MLGAFVHCGHVLRENLTCIGPSSSRQPAASRYSSSTMPKNYRFSSWKDARNDRPQRNGSARNFNSSSSEGNLTIGLRIVYIGKKASHMPMSGSVSMQASSEQHRTVKNDLLQLERASFGAVVPRKSDVQLCPFMEGTLDVVWSDVDRSSTRFEVCFLSAQGSFTWKC